MDPYERFQPRAVRAIAKDFAAHPTGRFLLVIPTGGGKTFTAIRSIAALFDNGTLVRKQSQVVWVAHRQELLNQARSALARYNSRFPDAPLEQDVDILFSMISSSRERIRAQSTKLVVFDEAHRSAAPTYYDAAFRQSHAGILGLTATPSRHDGKKLDFDRESFSIGFPDLIKLNVLINPTIRKVKGITLPSAEDFASEEALELLNTSERDSAIIGTLLEGRDDYRKVIVFVGTKNHAMALYERMRSSRLSDYYESIAWVFGGGVNSLGLEREEFFRQEKAKKRSIIINVDLLTEGYDDPRVNTVVMAAPCSSKLYCFQVVGRAVRRDPENQDKKAFVLEVVDELPNIRYQIDNRWLFSDVSDTLEPRVEDATYNGEAGLRQLEKKLSEELGLTADGGRIFGDYNPDERYSVLLFKRYAGAGRYEHIAVPMTSENRQSVVNAFNYLSERMVDISRKDLRADQVRSFGDIALTPVFGEPVTFTTIYEAMKNQQAVISGTAAADFIAKGYPWITFISTRLLEDEEAIPAEMLAFIADCENRDDLVLALCARLYETGSCVVKLPLPLRGVIGRILPTSEVEILQSAVTELEKAKQLTAADQAERTSSELSKAALPLESRLHPSLMHIVRENYEWKKQIS
jgi:superfamily II DNA or RNA helicase